jgi:hypothetical protein
MTNAGFTPRETKNLSLDVYGLEALAWERAREGLEREGPLQGPSGDGHPHTHWLVTTRADGRPHVMPVGAVLDRGKYYVVSGPGTQKSTNLARDPRCSIAVAAQGLDIVLEGEVTRVTDDARLREIAAKFDDWGPTVQDGAFVHEYSAPSAGPPPWYVYEFTPKTVFGIATAEPHGGTRWRF